MNIDNEIIKRVFSRRQHDLLTKIFERDGLDKNSRVLCSLAYLQAEADWINLEKLIDICLETEGDFMQTYEVLLQGYLFCGYPRAIESFFCLKEAMQKNRKPETRKLEPVILAANDILMERGKELSKIVHKDKSGRIIDRINELCPDLGYLMIAEGYGHILCRDGLDTMKREMAIVASLTSLSASRQLNSHIRGARNVGCRDDEILEAIITGFAWIAPEKVRKSAEIWAGITGSEYPNSIDNIIL